MENHREKLAIFDSYAKEQGYKNWNDLLITFKTMEFSNRTFNKHEMNATDLVQKEALKRASERGCDSLELYKSEYLKLENSIISDENLVK